MVFPVHEHLFQSTNSTHTPAAVTTALARLYSPDPAHRSCTQRLHSLLIARAPHAPLVPASRSRARHTVSSNGHALDQPRDSPSSYSHTHAHDAHVHGHAPCCTCTHARTHSRGPDAPDPASSRPYTRWSRPVRRRGLLAQHSRPKPWLRAARRPRQRRPPAVPAPPPAPSSIAGTRA